MLTEAVIAVIGAVAGQLIRFVIDVYRTKRGNVNQWYEDSISSISYGRGVCDLGRDRSNINYGNIANEAKKVSHRLRGQIDSYPSGVDERSVMHVKILEKAFRKLSAATDASDDQSTMDAIEELFEIGQRDLARSEVDMGEAVNESTEYSPTMNYIFDQVDADPQGFGTQVGEKFSSAESFRELLEMVQTEHGVSQRSANRKLDDQFFTEDWDKSLSVGIRILLQMTSNRSIEAINHLGEMNNKSTAN